MILLFELATYRPVWVHEKVIGYQIHFSVFFPWGAESIFPFELGTCGFEDFPISFEAFPTGFEASSIIVSSRLDAQNEFEVFWVLSMCHTHSHTSTMFFQNGKHVKIYSSPYTKYSEHVSTWSSQWSFTWKKDHHHWFIIENLNTSTDLPWTRIWIPIVIFNELEYKVFISRY